MSFMSSCQKSGAQAEARGQIAVVESVKGQPVVFTCRLRDSVVEVNKALEGNPRRRSTRDPFGEGWIFVLKIVIPRTTSNS